MRYAVIESGLVVNIILTNSPAPNHVATDTAGIGWAYDGQNFIAPPAPEPGRLSLPKSVVQERVNSIGKLGAVMAVLNSQPIFFARWFAPDWPEVFADDEGLLQILAAVGCTEAEIAMVVAA